MSGEPARFPLHIHILSDGTGESARSLVKAGCALFPDHEIRSHVWTMVRTPGHLERAFRGIRENQGPVFYSLVNPAISGRLMEYCRELHIPGVDVMAGVVLTLANQLQSLPSGSPGSQHRMDRDYFHRISAIEFAVSHDDGRNPETLDKAQVVLVGVSRVSKTPITLYLANRGFFAANVPFVAGMALPSQLLDLPGERVIGLVIDANRLAEIRRERVGGSPRLANYHEASQIRDEIREANRLFRDRGWRVLEVTNRAVEESAAAILTMMNLEDE